jgi:diguanylate cyclase (GGDEF)-like protein
VKYADSDSRRPVADPREDGLTFSVAHSGERILVPDIREHPIFEDAPGTWEGSIIGLPLIFHGQVLGVMNVAFSRPHAFNEQTLRLLDVLSNQASIAIHNARTYEGERDQRRLAEALQNTGRALQSSLELETVLDQILAQIETVIPYDSVNLMLVEKGRAEVVRRQGYQDLHPELLSAISETPIAINEFSTLRTMMHTRAPLIISNTKTDPRWVDTKSSSIILSWAGAPIIDENQVIGFLSLNKTEPDFYHPEHAERLSTFAGQAAIALRHARLFEQIQENARALGALHQATTTSVSTLKLDDLLRKILQGALEAIPSGKRGAIYLVNDHGSALTNQACSGFEHPPPESYSLQENGELIVRAYRENQALLIPLSEENRLQQPGRGTQPPTRPHLRMAAPLPAQDRMLGVILLEASQGEIFTREDLEILTSIAATTANAVRNAQLHAEIQAKAVTDSLTDIFNRRGLDQWGQYEFDRARRFDRPLSVIFFDLDHFKEVNDTHGHEIGDLVLKQLVSRCQQVIRTVDIFARFGGEEFVVILPETDLELALQVAERMREAVAAEPFEIHSISIQMSISLGVTTLSPSVKELNVLINAADQYMYQAKQSGRNTVAFPSH